MTRDELLAKLRELRPWLEEQGIFNARLFGSYARDEAGPDSDVDIPQPKAMLPLPPALSDIF